MNKPFVMYPRDDHSDSLYELRKYPCGQVALLSETSPRIKGRTYLHGWKECSGYDRKCRAQGTRSNAILLS